MDWGKRNPSRIPRKRYPNPNPCCPPAAAAAPAPIGVRPKTLLSLIKANGYSSGKNNCPKEKTHPYPSRSYSSLIGLCRSSTRPLFTTLSLFRPLLSGRVKERCKTISRKFQRWIIPKFLSRRGSRAREVRYPIGSRIDEINRRSKIGDQRAPKLQIWRIRRKKFRRRGLEWGWKMKKSEIRARLGDRAMFKFARMKFAYEIKECKEFRGAMKVDRTLMGARFGFPVPQGKDFEEMEEYSSKIGVVQENSIGCRGCLVVTRRRMGSVWRQSSRARRLRAWRCEVVLQRSSFGQSQVCQGQS